MLPLLLLCYAHHAEAWMAIAQKWPTNASGLWRPEQIALRGGAVSGLWNTPSARGDSTGLGGGISYAWDPRMCAKLLSRFDDNIYGLPFVDCTGLRAAAERAFAMWEAHHPVIRFHDVTAQCNATYGWPTRPDGASIPCPLSELWITAAVNATGHDLAASQVSNYNWTRYLSKPNGRYTSKVGVYAAVSATISFNTGVCWYLDSTFCSGFHAMKRSIGPDGALQLGRVIIFLLWTAVLIELLFAVARWVRAHAELLSLEVVGVVNPEKHGEVRAAHAAHAAHSPHAPHAPLHPPPLPILTPLPPRTTTYPLPLTVTPYPRGACPHMSTQIDRRDLKAICAYLLCCGQRPVALDDAQQSRGAAAVLTDQRAEEYFLHAEVAAALRPCCAALRLLCLLLPVLFYAKIFLPCFDCYSFEATVAHEVGHLLGMHHPDQARGRNMALDKSVAWDCTDEWASVVVDGSATAQPALMSTHTQTPGADCLTQDDLDGLNTLYPTCVGTVTKPACHAQAMHVGWIRLVLFVGIPVVFLLLCVLAGNRAAVRGHERNRDALRRKHGTGDAEARLIERRRFLMEARHGKRTGSARAAGRHLPTLLRREPASADGDGGAAGGAGSMVELAAATHNGGVCVGGGFGGAPSGVEGAAKNPKKKSVLSDGDRLKAYSAALKTTSSSASLFSPPPSRPQVAPSSPYGVGELQSQRLYMQQQPPPPRPTSVLAGVIGPGSPGAGTATPQQGPSRLPPLGGTRLPPMLPPLSEGRLRAPP